MSKVDKPSMATQIRGAVLRDRIAAVISDLATEFEGADGAKCITMQLIAERVPCSRSSLYNHFEFVRSMIEKCVVGNPRRGRSITTKRLNGRIAWQRKEIDRLRDENLSLRRHHVQLYAVLMKSSANLTDLIELDSFTPVDSPICVLCGAEHRNNDRQDNILTLHIIE